MYTAVHNKYIPYRQSGEGRGGGGGGAHAMHDRSRMAIHFAQQKQNRIKKYTTCVYDAQKK